MPAEAAERMALKWLADLDAETRAAWVEWFASGEYSVAEDDFVRFHDLNEDGTE